MYYRQDEPYGACGVNHVYEFSEFDDTWGHSELSTIFPGQAGLVMAAFIKGDANSQKAYKELRKKFKIVYQSQYRVNHNSGNMFKLVIYDGYNPTYKQENQ